MIQVAYVKMWPDAKAPFKKRELDSGYDVFAYHFVDAYVYDPAKGEVLVVAEEDGEIPGITSLEAGKVHSVVLNPNERVRVGVGLKMAVMCQDGRNFELQVRPRSGLSWECALDIINSPGTVDSPYRGEVIIIIRNSSNKAQRIELGDKIAQLVPMEIEPSELKEVDSLPDTDRGAQGFNSSGRT
jgi:dUTP pyrophosphatase